MILMQPALVVFDLDGTLIDSAPDMHRAVNRMLGDLGCEPLSLSEVRSMVGDGASALIARALAARQCVTADPAKALAVFLEHYEEEPTAFTKTFPDVQETLGRLRAHGLMLALCTNKPARLTQMILKRLEIEQYFVRVIAGDSLPFRKPDPRALLAVLTGFDTHTAATIMVGDSEVDAATAHAAAVPFVLMTYGYHRGPIDGISSIATLDHFHELATLLHA
jgi:phosphoglycolate phosphatase